MATSVAGKVDVREAYELWAPTYAREVNPLLMLQERTLEPLLPPIRGRRLVDVGCGTGRWLRRLMPRGPRFGIGVDLSPGMLRQAQSLERVYSVICADLCALPLNDRSADLLICSLALDHVENLAAVTHELGRVLDDNGILLLSDFHPDAHARGWKRTFKAAGNTVELPVHPRQLSTIHAALRASGLWLDVCEEPEFSEADRPGFREAGREDLFEAAAAAGPALYVARYFRHRRTTSPCIPQPQLTLRSAVVAQSADSASVSDFQITDGMICAVDHMPSAPAVTVDLNGYMLLPGLINAHDHLEFSLFPRLGRPPYESAREWAKDIYHPEESPIRENRAVPKDVRLWFGGLKNLLCGVTTVSHHNPYAEVFADQRFPVRVVAQYGWAHSFAEEPDVRTRFESTPYGCPFVIHLGEGTDDEASREFQKLIAIDGLRANTVMVHGVALDRDEHRQLQSRGGALVWCPSSNLFLLGRTVAREVISSIPRVALGSDSAISGDGDLLDEARCARACGVDADRIYDLMTALGANVLTAGFGSLRPGSGADVIAIRHRGLTPAETLCHATHADIECVLLGGQLRLISEELRARWPAPLPSSFEPIVVEGVKRYVKAPVSRLLDEAHRHLGRHIRIAGKRVWQ